MSEAIPAPFRSGIARQSYVVTAHMIYWMSEELERLAEEYAKKLGFIEPAGGRMGEHRMALPDPSEEEVHTANAFLEQIWEDLPDADTSEWGDKRDHIEMGYEFGYTLPLHDLRDLLEDPGKHYFEKYENLPEGKEWPDANENWLKREILEVVLHSQWGNRRCREEMSGDPDHLIVLCKMGLEDSIKDLKRRL